MTWASEALGETIRTEAEAGEPLWTAHTLACSRIPLIGNIAVYLGVGSGGEDAGEDKREQRVHWGVHAIGWEGLPSLRYWGSPGSSSGWAIHSPCDLGKSLLVPSLNFPVYRIQRP